MGFKTALVAFTDGDIGAALRSGARADRDSAEELVRRAFPGYDIQAADEQTLADVVYPPDDLVYATSAAGLDLLCDRRLHRAGPDERPPLRALGPGRRTVVHAMHSGSDALTFAVWDRGRLVRSFAAAPDGGIVTDVGEPYPFERPYLDGAHPVGPPQPGWPNQDPYPLPFHPLDLGLAALHGLFGFARDRRPGPDDIDPGSVPMYGFRITDLSGHEQEEHARIDEIARAMVANGRMHAARVGLGPFEG